MKEILFYPICSIMLLLVYFNKSLFEDLISFYTIDGLNLAPYPNMTDEELYEFEKDMNIPKSERTWPNLYSWTEYKKQNKNLILRDY